MGKNKLKNESDSLIDRLFTHLTQITTLNLSAIVATVATQWTLSQFGVRQITHATLAQDMQWTIIA